jgi:hypothetical protein
MQIYLYFSEHKSLIPLVVRTQAVLPLPSAISPQPSYISPQPSYISHHTSYISVKQVPVPHVPVQARPLTYLGSDPKTIVPQHLTEDTKNKLAHKVQNTL